MKTATIDDLRHRLAMVFSWLESGEDVVVKSSPTAQSSRAGRVDWSQSAAFRDRSQEPSLTAAETAELYESYKGEH